MPGIKCKACGKRLQTPSAACPNCGAAIRKPPAYRTALRYVVLPVLVVAALVALIVIIVTTFGMLRQSRHGRTQYAPPRPPRSTSTGTRTQPDKPAGTASESPGDAAPPAVDKPPASAWTPKQVYEKCMAHTFAEFDPPLTVTRIVDDRIQAWRTANPGKKIFIGRQKAVRLDDRWWRVQFLLDAEGLPPWYYAFKYDPDTEEIQLDSDEAQRHFKRLRSAPPPKESP